MDQIDKIILTVKTMWNIKLKSNLIYLYYANISPVRKMARQLNTMKNMMVGVKIDELSPN